MTRNLASKTIQEVRKRKSKIFGFKHTLTNEGIQDKKKKNSGKNKVMNTRLKRKKK